LLRRPETAQQQKTLEGEEADNQRKNEVGNKKKNVALP
jgi:hypothetical protein